MTHELIRCSSPSTSASFCAERRVAAAQDLFELEVFEYRRRSPGAHELEFHTNALTRGSWPRASIAANHRPAHMSAELKRGWTNRLETGDLHPDGPVRVAPAARGLPAGMCGRKFGSVSCRLSRYASRPARNTPSTARCSSRTPDVRVALDCRLRARPFVPRGEPVAGARHPRRGDGLEPVFDVSARGEWQLSPRVALAADYFSAAATVRHLAPESDAHHLIFGGRASTLPPAGSWASASVTA